MRMPPHLLSLTALALVIAPIADAAITVEFDPDAFAQPGDYLRRESFARLTAPPGFTARDNAPPLGAKTDDAFFAPGDIQAGIEFDMSGPTCFRVGKDVFGSFRVIAAAAAICDIEIDLDPGVRAIGFEVMDFGGVGERSMRANVYGRSGLIDQIPFTVPVLMSLGVGNYEVDPIFVGLRSTVGPEITRVVLEHVSGGLGAYGIKSVRLSSRSLLSNAHFDDAQQLTGWSNVANSTWSPFDVVNALGSGSVVLTNSGPAGLATEMRACAAVRGGEGYRLLTEYKVDVVPGASAQARLALEWFDGPTCNLLTDASLGTEPEHLSAVDSSWAQLTARLIAPPGAAGALVLLRNHKTIGATGVPIHLSFDDVMLVPEPESAALAMAAFLAVAFLRRAASA